MRSVLAWLVALLASCAPDYGHTAFRCSEDHGCPTGQTCMSGRCLRAAPTGDGVVCGKDAQGDTQVCDTSQQCCIDLFNGPRCIAAGDVCPGTSALCDGSEDCQAGDRCCADGGTVFCDAACDRYACRDAADCPSTVPNCCFDDPTPWGQCSPFPC